MNVIKVLRYLILIAVIAAVSCEMQLPKYPSEIGGVNTAGTTEGLGGGRRSSELKDYPAVIDLAHLDNISDNFMRGVDISNCYIIEQAGGVYFDHDGNAKDIIEIFKENGVNWIRLRLWHNHKLAYNPGPYAGDGDNDLVKTKAIARRAKAAGLKFLLNFHYSDNWADPGRQQVPSAWKDYNVEQLINAVYEYTFDTIEELKAAGAEPDMVQIGNEINPGLLTTTNGTGAILNNATNTARALNAGARAVRLAAPNAKIMLHLADGGKDLRSWFNTYTFGATAVDYDVIGLSWYPYYSPHGTIDDIYNNLRNYRTLYSKETVLVEAAWSWMSDFDGDELSNLFHTKEENQTAVQMPANSPFVINSGIQYQRREDGTWFLKASPENQARVLRAFIDMAASAGASGIFYWAPDWIPFPGLRSNWENQALFDFDGKALPSIRVMGIPKAGTVEPPAPANVSSVSGLDYINLSWLRTTSATHYQVDRSASENGPWTVLSDNISDTVNPSFKNDGLLPGQSYYYRVRAHNPHGWGLYSYPKKFETLSLTPPSRFFVFDTTSSSNTLRWTAVADINNYEISFAQSESQPAEGVYTLLPALAGNVTQYAHTGLTSGAVYWYRIRTSHNVYGKGAWSVPLRSEVGTLDLKASVNMNTGTLDDDFLDTRMASVTNDTQASNPVGDGGQIANYSIRALYAVNDADNLYIALDFGNDQPAGYNHDRIVVWIDNTSSSSGGAFTDVAEAKIAGTQNITGSIEALVFKKMDTPAIGGAAGASINATTWIGGEANQWLNKPIIPEDTKVIKFSIPLSSIGNAQKGNVLRIFTAFSEGWSATNIVTSGYIPRAAVNPLVNRGEAVINVNMNSALSYTVK